MELVLARTALLGGYGSILGADNRIANGAVFHTTEMEVEVAFEYSQCIDNVAVLKEESIKSAIFHNIEAKKKKTYL